MEKDERDKWLEAGRVGKEIREYGISLAKPGVPILDIAREIEKKTSEMGAKTAFPPNLSINTIAAHYTPKAGDTILLSKGDILKIDVGASIDGYLSDTAATLVVGESENPLCRAAREALEKAIEKVKPGAPIDNISRVIEQVIRDAGFSPISNLGGHGVGKYDLHESGFIPNIGGHSSGMIKRDGVIAIEPFATTGNGYVTESSEIQILAFKDDKPVRSKLGRDILEFVKKEYNELPFAKRWIVEKFGKLSELELKTLVRSGAMMEFNVLREESGGLVSQFEHSILIDGDEVIVTTR